MLSTTETIREKDRFQFWKEHVCDTIFPYEIRLKEPDQPFFGRIVSKKIEESKIIRAHSLSQKLTRTPSLISNASEETIGICYLIKGKGIVSQDNREAKLKPGCWTLCDSTRPFTWTLTTPDHSLLALSIPKSKIYHFANIESMTASTFQCTSGLGKVIFDLISSILKELNKNKIRAGLHIQNAVIDLLAAFLNEQFCRSIKISHNNTVQLIKLKEFIKNHLRDPDLCAGMIADAFEISTRHCHSLFQNDEKSLSQYIRELRLERCRNDLEDPVLSTRSITEISFSWGFNNASHFSKLFKKYFGLPPKLLRPQDLDKSAKS